MASENTQKTDAAVGQKTKDPGRAGRFYDKYYKLALIVPIAMLVFSLGYLYIFNQQHGDFIIKDVTLTGGTSVTVFDGNANVNSLKQNLSVQFPDIDVRGISDISTGKQHGFIISTTADATTAKDAIEKYLGYNLTSDNSSIEFSGAELSAGFYNQLIDAILAAFLLMSWVVFIIFSESRKMKGIATALAGFGVAIALSSVGWVVSLGVIAIAVGAILAVFNKQSSKKEKIYFAVGGTILIALTFIYPSQFLLLFVWAALIYIYIKYSIPSFAVILSAFADIIMTVAAVDIAGMKISSAGIIAFLMLIGYSVDTDILLTSRLLRNKEGSVHFRLWGAFKTGITMTLTAIAAVGISLLLTYTLSDTLRQIFTIVLVGLFFDIFNTWFTNASMLRWHMEVKKLE